MSSLLDIAKGLAKEFKNGGSASIAYDFAPLLIASPEDGGELVALLSNQGRKKRPNADVLTALLTMLETGLEEARQECENRKLSSHPFIESVRAASIQEAQKHGVSEALVGILQAFSAAKVEPGEDLKNLAFNNGDQRLEDGEAAEGVPDFGAALQQFVRIAEKLAEESDEDAFVVHQQLQSVLGALPPETHHALIDNLAQSDSQTVQESLVGFLLAKEELSARVALKVLSKEADRGRLSSASLGRLAMMRNWVDEPLRSSLDALTRTARAKNQTAEAKTLKARAPIHIFEVLSSPRDGAGAQNWFLALRQPRKQAVAAFLTKHGFGVRDGWVRRGLSAAEAKMFLGEIESAVGVFESSLASATPALEDGLAQALETGQAIPFGLVDVIETAGLGVISPKRWSATELVAWLMSEHAISDDQSEEALERANVRCRIWSKEQDWMQSWFDDGEQAVAIAGKGKNKKDKIARLIKDVVAPRRQFWGENLAWTALAARDAAPLEDLASMLVTARALLGDQPIEAIALAGQIAQNILAAATQKRSPINFDSFFGL